MMQISGKKFGGFVIVFILQIVETIELTSLSVSRIEGSGSPMKWSDLNFSLKSYSLLLKLNICE